MATPANKPKRETFPWLWPVLFILVGIVLLLDNFLLLGDFNAIALLPLLLVVAGAQILLRGDLVPSTEGRTFGVTRGSVESGTLEISAGSIDVDVRALQREGRLIAGQYASGARPALNVRDTYTHIRMDRSATPWYSFADWQVGLANDLPWQFLISTHFGQIDLDLSELIVHEAVIASGIGDIRVVAPMEAFKSLYVQSAMGNVHLICPEGSRVRVTVDGGRLFRAHVDSVRFEQVDANIYETLEPFVDAAQVDIRVKGTFGDVYLA